MELEIAWYLPFLIYLARICDVSIGTVRTILVISGHPYISAVLGFFEVIIWVLAVGGVITNLTNIFALLAYAGGFATGVIVGMAIENRIALGYRIVRVISADMGINLSAKLRELGYRVTRLDGSGKSGPVEFAFMVIRRRELPSLRKHIATIDPKCYVSVGHADRPTAGALGQHGRFSWKLWPRGTAVRK
jgi:uncharacterized protein YebE (UPF0316 family)